MVLSVVQVRVAWVGLVLVGCLGSDRPLPTGVEFAAVETSGGSQCSRLRIVHDEERPTGLYYLKPLYVEYRLASRQTPVLQWESPDHDDAYVGSCMAGLAGLEPAAWLQPEPVETPVTAGAHLLRAQHTLVQPVGGYPGAVQLRFEKEISFVARCEEAVEIRLSLEAPTITEPITQSDLVAEITHVRLRDEPGPNGR